MLLTFNIYISGVRIWRQSKGSIIGNRIKRERVSDMNMDKERWTGTRGGTRFSHYISRCPPCIPHSCHSSVALSIGVEGNNIPQHCSQCRVTVSVRFLHEKALSLILSHLIYIYKASIQFLYKRERHFVVGRAHVFWRSQFRASVPRQWFLPLKVADKGWSSGF